MEKIGIIGSGTWGTAIAVLLRNNGHEVTLWSAIPAEIEEMAKDQQDRHRESSGKEGLILDFLDREIPSDWDSLSRQQRQMFWNGNLKLADGTELVPREKACAVEIWVECFGGEPKHMKRTDSMEINNILIGLKGWERIKTPRRFGVYGQQRGFCRAKT